MTTKRQQLQCMARMKSSLINIGPHTVRDFEEDEVM